MLASQINTAVFKRTKIKKIQADSIRINKCIRAGDERRRRLSSKEPSYFRNQPFHQSKLLHNPTPPLLRVLRARKLTAMTFDKGRAQGDSPCAHLCAESAADAKLDANQNVNELMWRYFELLCSVVGKFN